MGKFLGRIYYLVNRERLARELADEMSVHREMMNAERRNAFGNQLRLHDESRDIWGWLWVDHLIICARMWCLLCAGSCATGASRFLRLQQSHSQLGWPQPCSAWWIEVSSDLCHTVKGDRLVSVGLIMPQFGPGEVMLSGAYHDLRASQTAMDLTSWRGVAACELGGDSPQRLNCARAEATFLPTREAPVSGGAAISIRVCGCRLGGYRTL